MKYLPKVFISYCHEGMKNEVRDFIYNYLHQQSDDKYEVLLDKNLGYGKDFNQYMDLLDTSSVVVILLSKQYKDKVKNREGGVYQEYTKILERMEQKEKFFLVIPIIVNGDRSSTVIDDLKLLNTLDITGLHFSKSKLISNNTSKTILLEIDKICSDIRNTTLSNSTDFVEEREHLFKILFKEPKADFSNPEHTKYLETSLVKTHIFNKIKHDTSCIIIGRKGSGKSTLTQILPIIESKKYFHDIPILANDFDLDTAFNMILSEPHLRSDLNYVFKRRQAFRFSWILFFHLCTIDSLVTAQIKNKIIELSTDEMRLFINHLQSIIPDYPRYINFTPDEREARNRDVFKTLFTHSISIIDDFINHSYENARTSKLYQDLGSSFTENKFIEFDFQNSFYKTYTDVLKRIGKRKLRILFSLDGFDFDFEKFKKDCLLYKDFDLLKKRALFDIDWLGSLIQILFDKSTTKNQSHPLFKLIDFCITIPEDRYLELKKCDRDAYRFLTKSHTINWTGIELLNLIRKRLEDYTSFETKKSTPSGIKIPLPNRLDEIMKAKFEAIPNQIKIEFKGIIQSLDLFNYVLRHTFWRPREIITYYHELLTMHKVYEKYNDPITEDDVKLTIRRHTYHIINEEFIGEFDTSLINIEDIISAFRNCKQILNYDSIFQILKNIHFNFIASDKELVDNNSLEDKIEYLFKIGFLGFVLDDKQIRSLNSHKYAFVFNEGRFITKYINHDTYNKQMFVIHPIFCEYLGLQLDDNKEFVLNIDYAYLIKKDKQFASSEDI